jgi:hypothetical protein
MSKTQKVKEHLIKHKSITSWEAIKLYKATRLSSIIFNLKKTGMKIISEKQVVKDKKGVKTTFAKYIYTPA